MDDQLLHYYNEELEYLRKQGRSFAQAHPKVGGHLRLGPGTAEDPFVNRLLESFAFLTSRLRVKLDDEQKFLNQSLLNTLYPHFLQPVPSRNTIQFQAKEQLDRIDTIKKGTLIEAKTEDQQSCLFSSTQDVAVWPTQITECHYSRRNTVKSKWPNKIIKSNLKINLHSNSDNFFRENSLHHSLNFYIDLNNQSYLLYHLLFNHLKSIIITTPDRPDKINELPYNTIQPHGFTVDQSLIPFSQRDFNGFQLLADFFSYPEKFLYFNLTDINQYIPKETTHDLTIYFLFDTVYQELEKSIHQHSIKQNCTPIINLFPQTAEPIKLNQEQHEYQVIADAHRPVESIEIFQLTDVSLSTEQNGQDYQCLPYFSNTNYDNNNENKLYWYSFRKHCHELGLHHITGFENFISFSLPTTDNIKQTQMMISAQLLCTNRELPIDLTVSNDQAAFTFYNSAHETIEQINCLDSFKTPFNRQLDSSTTCDLISHLQLNQLSFDNDIDALNNLKKTLSLYHYKQQEVINWIEEGLLAVQTRRITQKHPEPLKDGYCQGIEYTLTVDKSSFSDYGYLFLFGSILSKFLSRSCSINSFVKLIINNPQHQELLAWPAQLGTKKTL